MRINVSPRQLAAFLDVARAGSFSEAAVAQGISQPALSRTIQILEKELEQRLFDRSTRKVELTPAGQQLRLVAERLLGEFDNAFEELAQFTEGRRGRVVIAGLPSVCAVLLPGAIARFQKDNPAVDVRIEDGLSGSVVAAVLEGRAEIGLTVQPTPNEALNYRPLLADEFGLVCRADDFLAARERPCWALFETRPFIALSAQSSVRLITDSAFQQIGAAIKPLYECAFLGTAGNLVNAGLGITALPRLAFSLVGTGGLAWRKLDGPLMVRSLGILTRIGRSLSPAAEHFLAELAREAKCFAEADEAPR